jgi:hypothetical protein
VNDSPLTPRPIWCAVPSGENVTQGSVARWYSPPAHCDQGIERGVQVLPPSKETPVMRPRAAPPLE